ncbi:mannose-6-phosphate isomerase [Neocloeon triangulifer]|uniref:mannose-6-phosphate isomerase n=1 Tax=Neocloeon triangulifer TaxID=2078957 RepID=UPI00286EE25A|nr:mannose-6-phosphate isomerase [Neocloeon triangulifer]XP_059471993.1 mannose-6-phosphate isomerase [Neocloeon triangulifer]
MELLCKVQTYDWGSRDPNCHVHQLSRKNDPTRAAESITGGKLDRPHAEIWIGTHINGPSVLKENGKLLSEYITENPESVGEKTKEGFGVQLPFLLKVLSVSKPLSIQAHPLKAHAEELHAKFPDIYKDPNHKPEMLITLSKFLMLRGFRPVSDIKNYLQSVPELRDVLGADSADFLASCDSETAQAALKQAYRSLMTASDEKVSHCLNQILSRVSTLDEATRGACLADLLEKLHSHFPGDVGCLSVYFLQDYEMAPGEAAFLPANLIHAYIEGECIELMACSDNVVRGGLTPKLKDVDTLCSMLEYEPADNSANMDVLKLTENCTKYIPHGIKDFSILNIMLKKGDPVTTVVSNGGPTVVLSLGSALYSVDNGPKLTLQQGQALFIKASQTLNLHPDPEQEAIAQVVVAQCNF